MTDQRIVQLIQEHFKLVPGDKQDVTVIDDNTIHLNDAVVTAQKLRLTGSGKYLTIQGNDLVRTDLDTVLADVPKEFIYNPANPTLNIDYDPNIKTYFVRNITGTCLINIFKMYSDSPPGTLKLEIMSSSIPTKVFVGATQIQNIPTVTEANFIYETAFSKSDTSITIN